MNCTENILKKLRESRISEAAERYIVVDSTSAETEGDSEKYRCNSMQEVEEKIEELVSSGSDRDQISVREINNEEIEENTQYLSSLNRDVMRVVNALAPSALYWKNGSIVKNTKTGKEAELLGYKKDFHGNYQAVFSSEGKEFSYSLRDLQKDIKDEILLKVD